MKRLVQIILVAALTVAAPVQAVRNYSCDFETEAARNRWVINPVANQSIYNNLKNKWYMGAPGNNGKTGQYGLYISDDNGQSAHYRNSGCWVFAYDTVSLDYMASGDYTLSFDYCAMANVASNFDGLYVLWIPMLDPEENIEGGHDSIKVMSIATSTGTVPSDYDNYVLRLQPTAGMDYVNGTSTWRQCAVTIKGKKCDGTPHYLAFVWANGANQAQQPGAMVDNIEITDSRPCDPVTDLVVTPNGTSVGLTWTGNAPEYEVSAYSYEDNTWAGPKIVTTNSANFSGLPVGQTDFIVRAKCDEGLYSLKTIVSKLIYYPDELCVDYLNLANAVCYIDNSSPQSTLTFNDFKQVQPVDYGPSSEKSRHVVHFDRNETEPRTGGLAKTIPDGELASIRLGNWEAENHAERIEFSFPVDTVKYPVLLLKYMPILEAPGHDDEENPRFKMEILIDGHAPYEDASCASADFNCNDVYANGALIQGASDLGWHLTPSSVAQTYADIVWKEWTTVGVNLRKPAFRGTTLTARLTTHDCTFSAHCGYAYFTLGCSDGKLKGMKCGKINETFEAPDGFVYRWAYKYNEKYRRQDGSFPEQYVLGREQTYEAGPQDDSLYVVDCMFVQDSSCYFSLYASTLATNPISVMKAPQIVKNCKQDKYTITFDGSESWVQEIDHVKGDTLVSDIYHIENYQWEIEGLAGGWSDEPTATFTFPRTGGVYPYTFRTKCGTCESVIYDTLRLEPLGPTHETQTFTLCDDVRKGAGFHWSERTDTVYFDYGVVDSVVLFSEATSCDSIIYLELVEPVRVYADTMVLPEQLPVTFHGRTYPEGSKSMIDTIPISETNCDTTWIFTLEIYESLIVEPQTAYFDCEGADTLRFVYDILRGRAQGVLYSFNTAIKDTLYSKEQKKGHYDTLAIALDPNLEPNVYNGTLLFLDMKPEFNVAAAYTLTLYYSPVVIAQRWNDVLAIRNDKAIKDSLGDRGFNYEFDSVQWYINDLPIEGANDFNYYTGKDKQLDFKAEYKALLRRTKDGVMLFTCGMTPVPVPAEYTETPHLTGYSVPAQAPMRMAGKGTAHWYDMLGRRHHSDTYDNSDIIAPGAVGYYLLVLQSDGTRDIRQVLVK